MSKLMDLLKKEKIAIITCYDASFASMLSDTEVDALLVGDSLGTRIKGGRNTLNVTMNEILYHTQAVRSGAKSLPIIADMPINSFDNKSSALTNANKIIEAGASMVKVEGGKEIVDIVEHLTKEKIFVCGHIGFTPQTKTISEFKFEPEDLLNEAKILRNAGISMIVLSMLNEKIDQVITTELDIPTISYKSSNKCTGKVEILYDLLGLKISDIHDPKKENNEIYTNFNFKSLQDFIKKTKKSK
ncbi:MAG: 3-methyl-2-oxobutanoate hydroxymethyltransferase [Nitrosomonadales bacterium]|nr:3-methyl-2-oxobutanoate hydroxymethyltransferase [Nitrosomonadales bacterium]